MQKTENSLKVLIADSSRENINKLGKFFKGEGFITLTSLDVKQTIAVAAAKKPRVIFIDAEFALQNEFEILRELTGEEVTEDVVVIVMGEITDSTEIADVIAAGASDYISKNLAPSEFLHRIQFLVNNNKIFQPVQSPFGTPPLKNVLLIEDNDLNQNYITAIIQEMGCSIDATDNGGTGLEMYLEKSYDLILTDINVPIINGIELTKIIRTKYSGNVPIIAISGHSEKIVKDNCRDAGINKFLTKPFTASELKSTIGELFPSMFEVKQLPEKEQSKNLVGEKNYSYENAILMSKGDSKLFNNWVVRFKEVLEKSIAAVKTSLENNEYDKKNKSFHELLNYSGYFGLDELSSHIQELNTILQHTSDVARIRNFYKKIEGELESIQEFYEKRLADINGDSLL